MEFVKIDNNFKDKEKLYSLNDEAFPKEERIPSEKLIGVLKECSCDGWAFYEDEFRERLQNLLQEIQAQGQMGRC